MKCDWESCGYVEASAKDNVGVVEIFKGSSYDFFSFQDVKFIQKTLITTNDDNEHDELIQKTLITANDYDNTKSYVKDSVYSTLIGRQAYNL